MYMREQKKLRWRFQAAAILIGLFFGSASHADGAVAPSAQVLSDFESVLASRPLPALSNILPSYTPQQGELPGLVVGYFETDSSDGLHWGVAFGEIVRHMVARSPRFLADAPGFAWASVWNDSRHPDVPLGEIFRTPRSLQMLGERHGIRQAVHGRVTRRNDEFSVDVVWLDLESLSEIRKERHVVASHDLPALTAQVARKVLETIGLAPERWDQRYLDAQAPASFDVFRLYAHAMTRWEAGDAPTALREFQSLLNEGHHFQAAVIDFLQLYRAGNDQSAHNDFIRKLAARHSIDGGIQRAALNQLWVGDSESLMREKIEWAQRIVAEDSADLGALIVLALSLNDVNRPADALRVSLEVLRRWPNNYHSWWLTGKMAERYAWLVRGDGWARTTPAEDLEFFDNLLNVADRCVDRALALHPHDVEIWRLAMNTRIGQPERVLAAFEQAASMSPHDSYIYRTALHFTRPWWNGRTNLQMKVVELAVKNNPDQDWPYWYYWEMVEGDYTPRFWIPGLLHSVGCGSACRQNVLTGTPWVLLGVATLILVGVRLRRTTRRI